MKGKYPLFVAVASGAGTLLALSLVLMFYDVFPKSLYEADAILGGLDAGDAFPPLFALFSLVAYFEAGLLHVFFRRRNEATRDVSLVSEVGQEAGVAGSHSPALLGAQAGVMAALLGLGLALPVFVLMTSQTLQDAHMGATSAELGATVIQEALMTGLFTLVIGLVLGAVIGALGGAWGGVISRPAHAPRIPE